jgi:hypothetical protein
MHRGEACLSALQKRPENGTEVSPVQIDTTEAATDTIDYVVTDSAGFTATSARTVIVVAAYTTIARSTSATSSSQRARRLSSTKSHTFSQAKP